MKRFRSALVNLGLFLLPFLLVEGAFRLLPVSQPPLLMPVNGATPVARFEPNASHRSRSPERSPDSCPPAGNRAHR